MNEASSLYEKQIYGGQNEMQLQDVHKAELNSTLFQISVNTIRQSRLVQHLGETLLLQ